MRKRPLFARPLRVSALRMFLQLRRVSAYRRAVAAVVAGLLAQSLALGQATSADKPGLKPILEYISTAWDTLTRSMTDCQSLVDPKMKVPPVLYLTAARAEPPAVQKLSRDCNVQVEHLPLVIHRLGEVDTNKIQPHGLLYLEHKYVVPGGRFNEMYGWDSYFIVRGLLRSGRLELARGMVDNFFFEIEHYGAMLNANRTYYLTRSQPPFLSSMFVDVYGALQKSGHEDPAWLAKAYADLEKDYEMWNREPHLAGDTGLSRYYDFGEVPAAEALQDENDIYRQVAAYFLLHPTVPSYEAEQSDAADGRTSGAPYSVRVCSASQSEASCETPRLIKL